MMENKTNHVFLLLCIFLGSLIGQIACCQDTYPIINKQTRLAYSTIQSAIDAALDGDELLIAPGIYRESLHLSNKYLILRADDPNDPQIASSFATVSFSDIEGGYQGVGNMYVDPCLVRPYMSLAALDPNEPNDSMPVLDYHLQSPAGHWDDQTSQWLLDEVQSPCIDAGDPQRPTQSEYQPEPPNMHIINIGAYGGTKQASKNATFLTQKWATLPQLSSPESVVYDAIRNHLYVSNNDGLSIVNLDGQIVTQRWVTGLNRPMGMALHRDQLLVVAGSEIIAIYVTTGAIIQRYPIVGAGRPNDIVIDEDGVAYFSDDGNNGVTSIFQLDQRQIKPWLSRSKLARPNGLCLDGEAIIACDRQSRILSRIALSDKQMTPIATFPTPVEGLGDGLRIVDEHTYLVGAWAGSGFLVSKSGKITPLYDTNKLTAVVGSSVGNLDVEYIQALNLLLIPTYQDNRIIAYELNRP
jgi:hypothetical protein